MLTDEAVGRREIPADAAWPRASPRDRGWSEDRQCQEVVDNRLAVR